MVWEEGAIDLTTMVEAIHSRQVPASTARNARNTTKFDARQQRNHGATGTEYVKVKSLRST
jgi:hypothetical protein